MLLLIPQSSYLRLINIDLKFQLSEILIHFLQLILGNIEFVLCRGELLLEILHLAHFNTDLSLETREFLVVIGKFRVELRFLSLQGGDLLGLGVVLGI